MYAVERQQWLVEHARTDGRLDVNAVADELAVARETVRRDLAVLERHGLVRRVHGGAIPVERIGFEGALATRTVDRHDEKARIAEYAVGMVGTAESLYIDEGSTCQAFADRLVPSRPITVVTNSLPVATVLSGRPLATVLLLGGQVRGRTLATIDHWALRMLDDIVIDTAFLGTNGITAERGLTCPDASVAAVKSRAVAQSRSAVLLSDGTKFGADSSYRFTDIRRLSAIVTDRSAGDGALRRIRRAGVEVVVV